MGTHEKDMDPRGRSASPFRGGKRRDRSRSPSPPARDREFGSDLGSDGEDPLATKQLARIDASKKADDKIPVTGSAQVCEFRLSGKGNVPVVLHLCINRRNHNPFAVTPRAPLTLGVRDFGLHSPIDPNSLFASLDEVLPKLNEDAAEKIKADAPNFGGVLPSFNAYVCNLLKNPDFALTFDELKAVIATNAHTDAQQREAGHNPSAMPPRCPPIGNGVNAKRVDFKVDIKRAYSKKSPISSGRLTGPIDDCVDWLLTTVPDQGSKATGDKYTVTIYNARKHMDAVSVFAIPGACVRGIPRAGRKRIGGTTKNVHTFDPLDISIGPDGEWIITGKVADARLEKRYENAVVRESTIGMPKPQEEMDMTDSDESGDDDSDSDDPEPVDATVFSVHVDTVEDLLTDPSEILHDLATDVDMADMEHADPDGGDEYPGDRREAAEEAHDVVNTLIGEIEKCQAKAPDEADHIRIDSKCVAPALNIRADAERVRNALRKAGMDDVD